MTRKSSFSTYHRLPTSKSGTRTATWWPFMSAKALSDLTGGRDFGNTIRENLLQRNRERTDAHPGGVIDRVRDVGAHADERQLTEALRADRRHRVRVADNDYI